MRLKVNGYTIKPNANLREADLRGADLQEADLRGANLRGADLRGASLRGASLQEADLWRANLRRANLRRANLWEADLQEADLWKVNLWGANLRGADLRGANLQEVNLWGANLWRVNLRGADLRGANLPDFQICPEVGGFYAWKKVTGGVIKLYIPAGARRTSSLVGRKCRASHAKVVEGNTGKSLRTDEQLTYTVGKTVFANSFDPDIRVECTNGIHFFMTKKEAEQW